MLTDGPSTDLGVSRATRLGKRVFRGWSCWVIPRAQVAGLPSHGIQGSSTGPCSGSASMHKTGHRTVPHKIGSRPSLIGTDSLTSPEKIPVALGHRRRLTTGSPRQESRPGGARPSPSGYRRRKGPALGFAGTFSRVLIRDEATVQA
jgi:hypothetical protein